MARRKVEPEIPDNVVRLPSAGGPAIRRAVPRPSRTAAERSEVSAIDALDKALKAKSPDARARHARQGLARHCDIETRALLLRQLYLGELESGRYDRARIAAEQMIALGTQGLPDVAHHDAARACQAQGDWDAAIEHLEQAAGAAPDERRAFHLSTLGGLLYAIDRSADAVTPLTTAVDEGGRPAPLLRGQLALAKAAARSPETARGCEAAYHELAADPSGEGYGRFVLGELAYVRGDRERAQSHLSAFLARAKRSRPAARAALAPEIARATATLGRITWN